MRRRLGGPRLRLVAWNAHNAPADRLRSLVRKWARQGADVIVLNEVWSRRPALEDIARDFGFVLFQEVPGDRSVDPVPEAGSTAVLVREAAVVENARVIPGTIRWEVFSANRVHMPRRHQRVRFTLDGLDVRLTGTHGPTNGLHGANREAFGEYVEQIAQWHDAPEGLLVVTVGDINWKLSEVKGWVAPRGIRAAGHNVDGCLVSGGTVRRRRLGKYGSDHYAIRYDVRPA